MPAIHVVLLKFLAGTVVAEVCRPKAQSLDMRIAAAPPKAAPISSKPLLAPRPDPLPRRASPSRAPATTLSTQAAAAHLPTTGETGDELRRRVGKELYKFEVDLLGGARIAGKRANYEQWAAGRGALGRDGGVLAGRGAKPPKSPGPQS